MPMDIIGTYDSTIYHNPANKYSVVVMRTTDTSVPDAARSKWFYRDRYIRFTAIGYELPLTDTVQLELSGEWINGKYGLQFQVEGWREIVPQTEIGIINYLSSGLVKGIGKKTAEEIVQKFGVNAIEIIEKTPEKLLEIRGITESKLSEIKISYAESRTLRNIMTLLAPFKLTPKTAMKIYDALGPECVDILQNSPFELCQISGFGFKRVDAIVQKTNPVLNDPMRIKGALHCALDEAKNKQGHLFLLKDVLIKIALKLLNERVPLPELRVRKDEVESALNELVLSGKFVAAKENIYPVKSFIQEDETARKVASIIAKDIIPLDISAVLEQVKKEFSLSLSHKQEQAVFEAFRSNLSVITGAPGTGKTTVLKTILEVYRKIYPDDKCMLMAPTGRAARRMAESTGFDDAKTMHSALGLISEETELSDTKGREPLDAKLIIVDEFSMVDMWLASKLFQRIGKDTKIILVGDPDQLPSVGAGNVFRELISCKIIPVTFLTDIFRQSKDSCIAHNAAIINNGDARLNYGDDFVFLPCKNQDEAADVLIESYCLEAEKHGIENVQILSPFRSEGVASADMLNLSIRELVNPFTSLDDEVRLGIKSFRIGDRVIQTRNTKDVSNGDLGFIHRIKDTDDGKRVVVEFGKDKLIEYPLEDLQHLELAYAMTIHKGMGSEFDVVLMPMVKAHMIMMYRNLLYTGITRAKKKVILTGQKQVLYAAISRNEISLRNTYLGARIRLYCKALKRGTEELKKVS